MKTFASVAMVSLVAMSVIAGPAFGDGNLGANGIYLPELKIDTTNLTFSQAEFDLHTGLYYHLTISTDEGADNLVLVMPDLLRNSWVDQISIDDVNVRPLGIDSIEFDNAATVTITFVPLRPGHYQIWSPGYEKRGLKGMFVVD